MAKRSNAAAMDKYLDIFKTGVAGLGPANKMVACNAEPTTFTEANATFALADVAMAGADFTIAAGDAGGNVSRKVTVAAKNAVPVDTAGTATHVALVDTVNSILLFVTTCTSQVLAAGNTVNFPTWKIEVGAPT
jgi:hypothetical protein